MFSTSWVIKLGKHKKVVEAMSHGYQPQNLVTPKTDNLPAARLNFHKNLVPNVW